MIGWNMLGILIDELPESQIRNRILDLIDNRKEEIMKSEL